MTTIRLMETVVHRPARLKKNVRRLRIVMTMIFARITPAKMEGVRLLATRMFATTAMGVPPVILALNGYVKEPPWYVRRVRSAFRRQASVTTLAVTDKLMRVRNAANADYPRVESVREAEPASTVFVSRRHPLSYVLRASNVLKKERQKDFAKMCPLTVLPERTVFSRGNAVMTLAMVPAAGVRVSAEMDKRMPVRNAEILARLAASDQICLASIVFAGPGRIVRWGARQNPADVPMPVRFMAQTGRAAPLPRIGVGVAAVPSRAFAATGLRKPANSAANPD